MSERGMSDPATFGRVDSDGTVYVKTAAGERSVGSWQAGTPGGGPADCGAPDGDLGVGGGLFGGRAHASQTLRNSRRLRAGVDTANVVGDLDGLAARLDKLAGTAEERAGAA